MDKIKVLNLYAGIGGNRKLWENVEVTAVEINHQIAKVYQNFFPNDKVIVTDAHQYLLEHYAECCNTFNNEGFGKCETKKFDFIWSSPPCPTHSVCCHFLKGQGIIRYPDMKLWQEIILLKHFFKGKYCVENVKSYYTPLIAPQEVGRHYFWANFAIENIKIDYQIGTFNRKASKQKQRKAIIREAQIPEFLVLHDLKDFKLTNKRQVLRNCVLPKIGLHVFNCAFKEK